MDHGANGDLRFLEDEKFDFDVSLSPASSKGEEEEDEVFVGPVSHTEQLASRNVSLQREEGGSDVQGDWTSLTGDQLEAICEEAHRLAGQLRCGDGVQDTDATSDDGRNAAMAKKEFIQDTELKLGALGHAARALSPIKRQTFCVQDSPMKLLPPAIQRHLLRGSSASRASSGPAAARPGTSSPAVGVRALQKSTLQGKATLGGALLPSKPVAPAVSRSVSKIAAERSRLQPLSRTAGVPKRSPSSRAVNRTESSEDLLSDSVSVASDTSDCSINSSLLGKRTLAPPSTQRAGSRLSGVRAPTVQGRRVTDRRNTSSSSSSMSSFNSSLSLSPAKGKLNSSSNRSQSSAAGPAPSSNPREPGLSRPRRSTISSPAARSQSAQAKKLSDGGHVKATRSTPLKRAESTPIQPTPLQRTAERTVSASTVGSARQQSGVKVKSKPGALVHPTPNAAEQGAPHANGVSKAMKSKRLSVSSTDSSRLHKLSAGSPAPSAGGGKPQQVAARRPSGLPTPVKRRPSTFQTPPNKTKTVRPPTFSAIASVTRTLYSAEKQQSRSPVPEGEQEEEPVHCPDIQPFCLEEELPISLPSNSPETRQTQNTDHETLASETASETVPTGDQMELEKTEESATKTKEVLLLDLPPPSLQPQEKLLIDLANTPDLIRTNSKSCTSTQLIDLSSPLIKWSPENNNENSAPLINLSF